MAKPSRSKALKNKSPFARDTPPKVVTILGKKIKIKVVKHLSDNGVDLLGAYHHEAKLIYLLDHPDWRSCLLHELTHSFLAITGVNEGLSRDKEESICIALENALGPLIFEK